MKQATINTKHIFLFVFTAVIGSNLLLAQRFNPGYLGLKQTISLESTISPCNALTGSKLMETNFGLNYEKVFKKSFGLQVGVQRINGHVNQANADYYDGSWTYNTPSYNYYITPTKLSFDYKVTEFNITPKFYFTENGAVAPYGGYFGIDLGYSFAKIKDSVQVNWYQYSWSGGSSTVPNSYYTSTPWKTHKALTLGFNFGNRRFISSTPISIFYQLNFAYIMAQTTAENLAYLDASIYNHQDLLESFMIRNFGNKKLIQFKFGLGYSF